MKLRRFNLSMFCLTVLLCTGGQSGHSAFPQGALSLAAGDRANAEIVKRSVDPRNHNDNRSVAYSTPFGQLDWSQVRNKITERDGNYYLQKGDLTLELTLDPHLQRDIQATLARERYIGAGVVMLDARTGAIAAIGELRSEFDTPLSSLPDQITRVRAPAASLMKIFTAAAAVQEKGMEPETEIPFRGGCQYLRNRNWLRLPRADNSRFSLAKAFATSCNTAFARLAIYHTGLEGLREYAQRFYMNRPIPSDLLIETSLAALPEPETATTFDVGEAGAGFGLSKLSPVHAAMLSAAISNEGRMMAPHIVRRARDAKGNIVYQAEPRLIGTPMDPVSAAKMMTLLKATVLQGTSRSHFLRRDTKRFRAEIGGKTGTLRDLEERKTLYTWFSGVGAAGDGEPGLALGVLVASPVNWLVRASSVASNSLGKYYAIHRDEDRFARGQKN